MTATAREVSPPLGGDRRLLRATGGGTPGGGAGRDKLIGGKGRDRLNGGAGADKQKQ